MPPPAVPAPIVDTPAAVASTDWDAVVIGTGMGGATVGHALARAGWRVAFCEKGAGTLGGGGLRGGFAEVLAGSAHRDAAAALRAAGRWTEPIIDGRNGAARSFVPFVGCGTGGSSALYGAALERFAPADFAPAASHPHAGDAALPDRWPVAFDELAPWYAEAERLFDVRAGAAPLSAAGRELDAFFAQQGLHPYRLPLATASVEGCRGCQGHLCARGCKRDALTQCLEPAVAAHAATLLADCEVVRIEATRHAATSVECRWRGAAMSLHAPVVILAAGALASPALLLASRSPHWPDGLANGAGLVGRHLMRHYVDLYALDVDAPDAATAPKELAWSDLYATGDGKLGSFQSFGPMPPPEVMAEGLEHDVRGAAGAWAAAMLRPARPLMRALLGHYFARRAVFASILEDLPFADNRVQLAADGRIAIDYRIRDSERRRIARFRELIGERLAPRRHRMLAQADNNERLAHACGTCRFGLDPGTSVLDRDNRAHDLDNLYVVDASCFPTSGGTNPALTVAANALRVAAHLRQRFPRVGPQG